VVIPHRGKKNERPPIGRPYLFIVWTILVSVNCRRSSCSEWLTEPDLGRFVGFGCIHAHFKPGRIDGLLTSARGEGQQGHQDESQSHRLAET
jgi:hypothetical protein